MTTRRSSLRYPGYDYRRPGGYFVTIRTHEYQRLFGRVADGAVELSPVGVAVAAYWQDIASNFPGVLVDTYVVMPDHLHGVIFLGTDPRILASHAVPDIVGSFKNRIQSLYRYRVAAGEWPPYRGRLWQRQYHDRIVRNDRELDAIRTYIEGNPGRWQERHGA
jgi:putative transposase